MNVEFLYNHAAGRQALCLFQKAGGTKLGAWFLHTKLSRVMIPSYISRNNINMEEFEGQTYQSFAEFFGRKKEISLKETDPDVLISPCDSLLSVYPIQDGLVIPMKGSAYRISDLVPDPFYANQFTGGACLIFRLEASDYHHFCYIDDGKQYETRYIPGELHSVQPIALEKFPVYRLNRRWWTPMDTEHFGTVMQIEVGAMMVGGVTHVRETGSFAKGEEMGNFELAGSTIALLIGSDTMKKLRLDAKFRPAWRGKEEVRVRLGDRLGEIWTDR